MKRRERLMATLQGKPVDRPAVSFYELGGLEPRPDPGNPYDIYAHPSWAPLLELARDATDNILRRSVRFVNTAPDPLAELTTTETWEEGDTRYERKTIRGRSRTFTSTTRRDRDVNTVWRLEHFLKDAGDLRAWLELPPPVCSGEPDISGFLELERELGDAGIVLIDTADPLCIAADLFDMGTYTVMATTEQTLFQRLLERYAAALHPRTAAIARALPGRHWRIVGPEYASVPYLRPALFEAYVVPYDRPMVDAIHNTGGYARIHSHGRLRHVLDYIAATGCMGLDPVEPPPQGDMALREVRERYGRQMVLFGNIEASDIENLATPEFSKRVRRALEEGTAGEGRGFVLMPSACPYGRVLSPLALANYHAMIDGLHDFAGVR